MPSSHVQTAAGSSSRGGAGACRVVLRTNAIAAYGLERFGITE